ncbi:MAG: glutamine-hydrolyzing carbamoyl-phosphate synthase small subunit [Patescibacteria group bacterium]|nr:glutamine-hydrolyzing carbamoyl-phosphate synthase small subunit [Patescibacteria group bacterium]
MKLYLEDGSVIEGKSFGAQKEASGEVVFNTGMVGYVESLTDPSYEGEILVLTYPLVGNYGVPDKKFFESSRIHAAGLVVAEYSETYSHHAAKQSLGGWLKASGVPAITGVDTRALTKKLREEGVMLGALAEKKPRNFKDPNKENLGARVSIREKKIYEGSGGPVILAIDCGMKENIVRSFVARGATVVRVPWDFDFSKEHYDGLFISNGPGDPVMYGKTVERLKDAMKKDAPILGICLGIQLLALAGGASTYKLKYGHRSHNQPCLVEGSARCYITSQNHGYAVARDSLPKDWRVWFTNLNDSSVEGIAHIQKPWRAVQFHPEAAPGPTDTGWIFDEFLADVKKYAKKHA